MQIWDIIYQPPPQEQDGTQSIFKNNLTGLNSKFSYQIGCHTKVKDPSLPYYLLIVRGKLVEFIHFPSVY